MYTFFTDPGHGWLRVPLADLHEVGFKPSKYSYYDKDYAYLEEDCDAPLFMEYVDAKPHKEVHVENNIFIRRLRRFQ